MAEYNATVTNGSREFKARERIRLKDEKLHTPLKNILVAGTDEGLEINVQDYAIVHVENPHSSRAQEYDYIVLMDTEGNTYATGSSSFRESFLGIFNEMREEEPEQPVLIKVYGRPSKNYESGFLTCSLV